MWDELAKRIPDEMVDLTHRSASKSQMLGMYHLFLGVMLVGISIGIYLKLPIQGEPNLVLPAILGVLYIPLLLSAAFWLQAGSIPDVFLRAGPTGLWFRIPEAREFMISPLPGCRLREELIPWYSIREITYHNSIHNLVAVFAGARIHKINGEVVEISTLYFVESVAHLRAKLDRVRDEFRFESEPVAGPTEPAGPGAGDVAPTAETVGPVIEVKLTKSSWMRRVFRITTTLGVFKVEWNGLRTGADSFPVIVNGETQILPDTRTEHGRRYEFRLKELTGYIIVRTSIFMTLRSVKLTVDHKLYYEEG